MLTDEQKALRRMGIGGSEIAAVLGLSPWMKPIDVWRAKVEGHEVEETEAMKRGRLLEASVCAWYAEDYDAELAPGETLSHPNSVLLATPDRMAKLRKLGEVRPLEAKTAGFRMADRWGETGSDDVPDYYRVQCAAELAVTQLPVADLAVLIAGDDFRVFHIARDLEMESMLLEAADKFWRDFVVTRKPPPPDASESYSEWLKEKYAKPDDAKQFIQATAEAEVWAGQLRHAKEAGDAAKELEQEARQHLESLIGNAGGMQGNGWRISWSQTKGKPSLDLEALLAEAGIPKSLLEKHTRHKPYRQFRPTFSGEQS